MTGGRVVRITRRGSTATALPAGAAARLLAPAGGGADPGRSLAWFDLVGASADELAAFARGAGLSRAVAGGAGPVGHRTDSDGWLSWGPDGFHLALALRRGGRVATRSLHVLVGPGAVITARVRRWPGLDRLARDLCDPCPAGRSLSAEVAADASVLAALFTEPVVTAARRATRRAADATEAIARQTIERPDRATLWTAILHARRELLALHRRYAPLVRTLAALGQGLPHTGQIGRMRFRDLSDRLSDSVESLENVREGLSSTAEAFASIQANQLSRVVQVLTVVSILFLPATLIASIYGMNFHIPEIAWPGGYGYSLALMAVVTAAMLAFLYRRGWL